MQGANPLEQLRDIHLPSEIGWWPLAYGWWLLMAFILAALIAVIIAAVRYRTARRYRHYALIELELLTTQDRSNEAFLAQLSALLKRAAIKHFGDPCKNLHGQAWLDFLGLHCPHCDTEQLAIICLGQYQVIESIERQTLTDQAQLWLKRHK